MKQEHDSNIVERWLSRCPNLL